MNMFNTIVVAVATLCATAIVAPRPTRISPALGLAVMVVRLLRVLKCVTGFLGVMMVMCRN